MQLPIMDMIDNRVDRFGTSLEMTTLSYAASLSNLASLLYYDMTTFVSKLNKILIKSCRILINIYK